jgi:beta-N-acetylhexosaminidase
MIPPVLIGAGLAVNRYLWPFITNILSGLQQDRGWLVVDLSGGSVLSKSDKELLSHPEVWGVILLKYEQYGQTNDRTATVRYKGLDEVRSVVSQVKAIRKDLKICIDHEGERICRFTDSHVIPTPFLSTYLNFHPPGKRMAAAQHYGEKVGSLLKSVGVEVLFGPVADRTSQKAPLDGRTISRDIDEIVAYNKAVINGICAHGIQVVLKHFPGLGDTTHDTHALPAKQLNTSFYDDGLQPFKQLQHLFPNAGVMLSHAQYPLDPDVPASMSYQFQSMVAGFPKKFTDDVSMRALSVFGTLGERLDRAKDLGYIAICMHNQTALRKYYRNLITSPTHQGHQTLYQKIASCLFLPPLFPILRLYQSTVGN